MATKNAPTRTTRRRRKPVTSSTEQALASVLRELESAEAALAHAANDLAHLAYETPGPPVAAIRFALKTRDTCAEVMDISRTLSFWWWLERAQRERQELLRANIRAGVESEAETAA